MSAPVFIIGAGRSGTKFLRDVLAASRDVNAIPYDVNFIWRHGNEQFPHDALAPEAATPAVVTYIRDRLARLAGPALAQGGILVEKTVSNALRVPFVQRVYPEARFVHLLRDGRDVTESALRMWQAKPELKYLLRKARHFPLGDYRYGLWFLRNSFGRQRSGKRIWGPRYPGIHDDLERLALIEVCAKQWATCVVSALDGLESPSATVVEVRYEALVREEGVIVDLCRALQLSDPDAVLAAYRARVRPDAVGRADRALAAETLAQVEGILAPALVRAGYLTEPATPAASVGG
jgi:hypothetical protein